MSWFRENSGAFQGQLLFDEPLSRHTYYRIGGPARLVAVPKGLDDLRWLSKGLAAEKVQSFILGLGSNVLVSDDGFDGLVIKTGRLNLDVVEGECLRTGVSVAVSSLLRRASQEGWGGLEFLTGVPGSIGGVVYMNAGTHLGEARDRLRKVEAFSLSQGELESFSGEALAYEYRKNRFLSPDHVVWSAEWKVQKESPAKVKAAIDETLARRKATQPIDYPSCGSVFKNPKAQGMSAWQVIDKLGLRGHKIGDAQISEKHSNFIVNLGRAKGVEVKALIDLAKSRAQAELGIPLEEEVRFLGRFK